jgi:RNA polymerase sigma-70 factor (ECF subfamily)
VSISQHDDLAKGQERDDASGSIERLICDARAGSTAALGQLMEGCRRYLLLVANRDLDSDLRPKAGASDLVQATFCDAHRDFAKFRGESEQEFFAWLTAILNHRIFNLARDFRYTQMREVGREQPLDADQEPMELTGEDPTPSRLALARDEESRLMAAIARLSEPQRRVLLLRTWERQSFVAIGATLEISPDAARQQWGSAVCRLKKELRQAHDD